MCIRDSSSTDEAVRAIEPPDAESEIRAAFDHHAVPYRVEWIQPNRRRNLWFFESISFGVYRFVPAGPANPAAFVALLENPALCTDPPEAKAAVVDLLAKIR